MPPTEEQVAAAEARIVEQSKRIDFYLTEYSIELLAAKMANGDFEIPKYQREDTWEALRKSRFVESLLIGLPIPFLFFWENPKSGKLEIVDGSQRLRTIQQFISGKLVLEGELDELPELGGFRFHDLPASRQRKIKNRSIRGIVMNEHADGEARFDIFRRINTGSLIAKEAEVRRGALAGPFLELVIKLAGDAQFESLAPVSDARKNLRAREELVTRFFAYGDGLEGYKDRPSQFLFDYAERMNEVFTVHPEKVEDYRNRFETTLAFVNSVFPFGFKKTATATTTPRSRFEAISIGSYHAIQSRQGLLDAPPSVTKWLDGDEFAQITGADGANAIKRLTTRINFVRDRLLGA